MADNIFPYELQKKHGALTTTKKEHTLKFRMIGQQKSLTLVNLYLIDKIRFN